MVEWLNGGCMTSALIRADTRGSLKWAYHIEYSLYLDYLTRPYPSPLPFDSDIFFWTIASSFTQSSSLQR